MFKFNPSIYQFYFSHNTSRTTHNTIFLSRKARSPNFLKHEYLFAPTVCVLVYVLVDYWLFTENRANKSVKASNPTKVLSPGIPLDPKGVKANDINAIPCFGNLIRYSASLASEYNIIK